ncbi:MAG TPA: DUF6166 domain-containing protein [Actinomycetota bacterium]|nr:DUF6166 domain-containing protein [Actinomycetota bacterium]
MDDVQVGEFFAAHAEAFEDILLAERLATADLPQTCPRLFEGLRGPGGCIVRVFEPDGTWRILPHRTGPSSLSPTGFEWGYAGAGPCELAHAVLAAELGPIEAELFAEPFKREVVARLPSQAWAFTGEFVRAWARRKGIDT